MKLVIRIFLISTVIALFTLSSNVNAGLFLHPNAGIAISNSGDTYTALGATAGYKIIDLISLEATYLYLDSGGENNRVDAGVSVDIPFIPIIDPYISAGSSVYPEFGDVKAGFGITFSPPVVDIVFVGAGYDYYYIKDGDDFSLLFATVGVSF